MKTKSTGKKNDGQSLISPASHLETVDELRVLNTELVIARKAALNIMEDAILSQAALRKSEYKYRTLFESIDAGFCIIEVVFDKSGKAINYNFLETNPAFTRLTFIQDPLAKSMKEMKPKHEDFWFNIYGEVAKTGEPRRFEHFASQLGEGAWYDVFAFRIDEPEKNHVAVLFNDISDRKSSEQRQDFILELSDTLRPIANSLAVQEMAMKLLGTNMNVNRAFYAEVIDNTDILIFGPGYARDVFPMQGRLSISAVSNDMINHQYQMGETVLINNVDADDRFSAETREGFAASYVKAAVGVPLVKNGKIVAILSVHQSTPRIWKDEEIKQLEETAELTWASVERAKAEEALRLNDDRMRAQKEAFQTVVNGKPLKDALNLIAEMIHHEYQGEARTAFYIADDSGQYLHPVWGAGSMSEDYLKMVDYFVISIESLSCGLSVSTNAPVLTTDVFEEPLWKPWIHLAVEHDFRGCWSFPIMTNDFKAIGTLALYFRTPREANAKDIALSEIATQAAAVIIVNYTESLHRTLAEVALKKSEEQLRHFNVSLEQEVDARTKEIEDSKEELYSKNKQLNHTIDQLESFNYLASHDLREPLRKIQTFVALMNDNMNDPQKRNQYLNGINEASARMTQLIDDLLSYSRLSQPIDAFMQVDLNEILKFVKKDYELLIKEKEAVITQDKLPVIRAIPIQMNQLFTNLLSNALKFNTGKPEIRITSRIIKPGNIIALTGNEAKVPYVEIKVADNGIGFDNRYNKKIFELFQRLHGKTEFQGTGIGLSIVEKIVKNHFGFIQAHGEANKGAEFTIWLPTE